MKFYICGDSYFSPSIRKGDVGLHFSELLCKQHGWQLTSLARGGSTNSLVRLQVDHAVQAGADFVLVGMTGADRIELPINPSAWDHSLNHLNMDYAAHEDLSSRTQGIAIDSHNTIANNIVNLYDYKTISKDTKRAVRAYVNHIYHQRLQARRDFWIAESAHATLSRAGIPHLVVLNLLDYWEPWCIDSDVFVTRHGDDALSNLSPIIHTDLRYHHRWHTSPGAQRILADHYNRWFRSNGFI